MSSSKKIMKNCLCCAFIFLASCIIFLVVAEIMLNKVQFVKDRYEHIRDPEPFRSSLNKQGFRVLSGDIVYKEKPGDYFRIICLGDSFTFGHGVGDNETYPIFLEGYLENSYNIKNQVINAGIMGTTITQQTDMYKNSVTQLGHDLVLILFNDNDFEDLAMNFLYKEKQWNTDGDIFDRRLKKFKICLLIEHHIERERARYACEEYYNQHREKFNSQYFNKLKMLNDMVKSNKATLVVVIFRSGEDLKDFCIDQHIRVIDISEDYCRLAREKDICLVYHHNELGNKLLAKLIADRLF